MDVLYLLIPISVVLVFAAGAVFWWALGSGQFEDFEGSAYRILQDDEPDQPLVRLMQIKRTGPGEH